MPLVSIIILNYNGIQHIEQCLKSVLNSNYENFEVIFVDNASTDGSYEYVVNTFGNYPRLKIIRNSSNLGFSGGNNIGIKYARGEYIVLLNNDTVVESDWLKNIIPVLEKHRDIALAQPVILYLHRPKIVQSMGFFVDKMLLIAEPFGNMLNVEKLKNTCIIKGITFPHGACLFIRKDVLKKLGLFDPRIILYFDDCYWGMLAWLLGLNVAVITNSRIYHKGRATIDTMGNEFIVFHRTISKLAIILRLYPLKSLLFAFPSFFVIWPIFILYKILKKWKKMSILSAVFKAYSWSLNNFGYFVVWRKKIRKRNNRIYYDRLFKHMLPNVFSHKKLRRLLRSGKMEILKT